MLQWIVKVVSWISLGVLVIPSLCFLAGRGTLPTVKTLMVVATVFWFITASMYMWKDNSSQQEN